ncbi:NAD-dependent epimerase/dehydratase family protein [Paenibacillus sp. MBLB4367]|uniref:NAD-dependent epimerase/dehydratase family protein n=1 Tax=Paenibacillus sp. MBLB4367 TaxID=3384767 RepID=UPI0039081544
MKALVTGATGFLGGALARRLAGMGWEVTAAGRNKAEGALLAKQGIRFQPLDLQDEDAVIRACRDQDYVFHSGALSSPWGRYADFYESNVLGTRHIAAGCMKHAVNRLIYVSTPSIYFDFTDRLAIAEDAALPAKPVNPYAATKLLAEREIERFRKLGLAAITLRPRALFGPGDRTILPRLLEANERGRVPLIGGGKAVLDLTYVDNAVDALLLCVSAPESALGKAYNITNGESVSLIEVLQRLFGKLGQPLRAKPIPYRAAYALAGLMELAARLKGSGREPLLTRYTVGVLAKSQTLDIAAAKRELGYEPKVSIAEGIDAFADWWRSTRKA